MKLDTMRSPYRRNRLFLQMLRPRLSRRVIATARVNLNSYWSRFEELSNENSESINEPPVELRALVALDLVYIFCDISLTK
ncbi:hypothetical protein ABEB36_009780 [Hypothenemus hampei]|uniref:Uncharacterized protein n=1 Tax=Hypothenemus hampei TaxID=57062 RepID=A0ABD1EHV1_HYPHA